MRTSYYVDRKSSPFDLLNDIENLFKPMFYDVDNTAMKTDILEDEKEYKLVVELAGFSKENISIDLKEGYLTIGAKMDGSKKEEGKKYILRERCTSLKRSFYVGDIKREDIKAKYENGLLVVTIPKTLPDDVRYKIDID